jgi:hypothetical protein
MNHDCSNSQEFKLTSSRVSFWYQETRDPREALQTRAEITLRPTCPPRHTAQLSLIAREEADNQIRFAHRPAAQDYGFAGSQGHS